MRNEYINYGFINKPIKPKGWILGKVGLDAPVINPSKEWPIVEKEIQVINGRDTYACPSFGTLNRIEINGKFFGYDWNFSDRFTAIGGGVVLGVGGSPDDVDDFIRDYGLVKEELLPTSTCKGVEEFYKPKPLTTELLSEAEKFILDKDYHDTDVFESNDPLAVKQEKLMNAMDKSSISVSVTAWFQNANGKYYFPDGVRNNHWCTLIKFEKGEYWRIFDSAEQDIKDLEWNCNFEKAKISFFVPVSPEEQERRKTKLGIFSKILEAIRQILVLVGIMAKRTIKDTPPPPIAPPTSVLPQETPIKETPTKIDWSKWRRGQGWEDYELEGKKEAYKMAKKICEDGGFPACLTNELLCTIYGESGFNVFCRNSNKDKDGKEWSFDAGIAQLSSAFYLKYYNMSEEDAYREPEKCVKIMFDAFRAGRADDWIAHRDGRWKLWEKKVALL